MKRIAPSRLLLLLGVMAVLLSAGGVLLVVKTAARPLLKAADDSAGAADDALPADPQVRAELVRAFGPLADAMHRLQAFWGDAPSLATAEREVARLQNQRFKAADQASYLIARAQEAIAETHKANDQAHQSYQVFDHEAGIHKNPASRPALAGQDFQQSEQTAWTTGKLASYAAGEFFNRYDELRGLDTP